MLQQWAELVKAAGLLTRDMDAFDIYMLGGDVMRDDILTKATFKFLSGGVLPDDACLRAIQEMTPNERAELRERVSGKVVLIRKESGNKNRDEQIARETAKEALLEAEEDAEQL